MNLRDHSTLFICKRYWLSGSCIMKLIMIKKNLLWLGVGFLLAVLVISFSKVFADQGFYVIDKSARPGMLMSVSANDPNVAEPAKVDRAESMIGILGDEPTTLDIQDGQKNVLTGGVRNTLVTTINGDIKKGDYITATLVVGFGGKLHGSGWAVGIAQADFDSSTAGAIMSNIIDTSNKQQEVSVGSVPVLIKVLYYDETKPTKERDISFIPEKFQKALDAIVGRRASQLAMLMASILLLVGLFVGGTITNSAVRNGIKSTARQPLAKQAILWRMAQACLIGLGVIIGSLIGAFVLLRLF